MSTSVCWELICDGLVSRPGGVNLMDYCNPSQQRERKTKHIYVYFSFFRPKKSWREVVEEDMTKINITEDMAEDRKQWRQLICIMSNARSGKPWTLNKDDNDDDNDDDDNNILNCNLKKSICCKSEYANLESELKLITQCISSLSHQRSQWKLYTDF